MPRNDQHIRQWMVLEGLQSSRGKTLQEIANKLPRDYPKHTRTIRWVLEALEAAGHLIINERVNEQTRWRLIEGYRNLPAINFSPSEFAALMMAQHLLTPLEGTPVRSALNSALAKTGMSVTDQDHPTLREFQTIFSFKLGPHKVYAGHHPGFNYSHFQITNRSTQILLCVSTTTHSTGN